MRFGFASTALFVLTLTLHRVKASHAHEQGLRIREHDQAYSYRPVGEIAEDAIGDVVEIVPTPSMAIASTSSTASRSSWAFQRRANSTSATTTSASATSSSSSSSSSSASSNSSLPLPPSVTPTSAPSPVPTPLDLSISYALSTSCVNYLTTLLSSSTFLSCLPFSLLLTTSSAYSSLLSTAISTEDYTTLNTLLAYTASPQPNGSTCDTYMSGVLSALTSKSNCASDISAKTQVALQAQNGIGNYQVMREAEALVDPDTGVYCYLEAVASDRPDDLYLWQISGGISLPSTSTPTCSKCSALLLGTYSSYSTTKTLNATLVNTAITRINNACGSTFVSLSAVSKTTSGAGAAATFPRLLLVGVMGTVVGLLGLVV